MKEREALSIAIEREREAYRHYSEAAERTTSESGKKLFSWLASEERGHSKILEEQWEKVKEGGTWLSEEGYCSYGDISHPIECTEFPSASEVKAELKENAPEMEIIKEAIAAERQATAFYADLANNTDDPSGKAMFEKLSKVEQGHLDLLEEEYELLRRSNALFTIHRFTLPSSA
jgi:rubrerythrin